jgi:hypothetical protein
MCVYQNNWLSLRTERETDIVLCFTSTACIVAILVLVFLFFQFNLHLCLGIIAFLAKIAFWMVLVVLLQDQCG